jgi:hypothetical protein
MIKKIIFLFLIFFQFLFLKPVFADFAPKNIDIRAVISDSDETGVLENTLEFPDSMKVVVDLTNSSGFPDVETKIVIQFDPNLFEVDNNGGGTINGSGTQVILYFPELLENENKHFEVILKPKISLAPNRYKTYVYASVSNRYGSKLVELVSNIISDTAMEMSFISNSAIDLNTDKPEINYVIYARNIGSSIAKNIKITIDLTPLQDLGIVGNISNNGVFDIESNSIIWNIAELEQLNELSLTFDFAITSTIEDETNISTVVQLIADNLSTAITSNTSSNILPKTIVPPVTPEPIIVEKIVEVPIDVPVEVIVEVPVDRIVEVPVEKIVEKPIEKIITKTQKQFVTKYINVPAPIKKETKLVEAQKVTPSVQGESDEIKRVDNKEIKPLVSIKWLIPLTLLIIVIISSILILSKKKR